MGSGGGGGGDSYDRAYNARMATIAEAQQSMGTELFDFWKSDAKPLEQAQIASNLELIPYQTEAEKERIGFEGEQMGYARELLPMETGLRKEQIGLESERTSAATELVPYQTETALTAMGGARSMMEQAGDINQREWMGTAQADVAQGYAGAEAQINRQFTPGSPEHSKAMQNLRFEKAKQVGGARTMGRRAAGEEKFRRTGAATTAASSLWRT